MARFGGACRLLGKRSNNAANGKCVGRTEKRARCGATTPTFRFRDGNVACACQQKGQHDYIQNEVERTIVMHKNAQHECGMSVLNVCTQTHIRVEASTTTPHSSHLRISYPVVCTSHIHVHTHSMRQYVCCVSSIQIIICQHA